MIHQVCSECLRLQRKAAPMSHLHAFGPQFSTVASLEYRTGFFIFGDLLVITKADLWRSAETTMHEVLLTLS